MNIEKIRENFVAKERKKQGVRKATAQGIIQKLKSLAPVWRKYNLCRVYLFGSFADTSFHSCSDIDIAYEPELSPQMSARLYADIDTHFHQEIDIRCLNEIAFVKNSNWNGILIYERENCNSHQ